MVIRAAPELRDARSSNTIGSPGEARVARRIWLLAVGSIGECSR
jgi:hypothetical protein